MACSRVNFTFFYLIVILKSFGKSLLLRCYSPISLSHRLQFWCSICLAEMLLLLIWRHINFVADTQYFLQVFCKHFPQYCTFVKLSLTYLNKMIITTSEVVLRSIISWCEGNDGCHSNLPLTCSVMSYFFYRSYSLSICGLQRRKPAEKREIFLEL